MCWWLPGWCVLSLPGSLPGASAAPWPSPSSPSSGRGHAIHSPQGLLLRWLKVNFSEAFIAWIHIKALRVFVESVLRCVGTRAVLRVGGATFLQLRVLFQQLLASWLLGQALGMWVQVL